MGLLSIPWTMTAEMYPMEVRGIMQGASICVAHLFMFGVIKTFYSLMSLLGGVQGLLLFYGIICTIGTVMLWVFLPETHKKTLDEIEEYFTHNTIYLLRKKSIYKDRLPVKTVDDTENPNVWCFAVFTPPPRAINTIIIFYNYVYVVLLNIFIDWKDIKKKKKIL